MTSQFNTAMPCDPPIRESRISSNIFRRNLWIWCFGLAVLFCIYELACMKNFVQEEIDAKARELQAYSDNAISNAIAKYDADKTGRVDFALKAIGGDVVTTRDTQPYVVDWTYSYFGLYSCASIVAPSTILQAKTQPGECWPFVGSQGTAVIKLISPVVITGVTYEHVAKSLMVNENVSSAPKEFSLKGLENPNDKGFDLGNFTYDINGPPTQYFAVQQSCERSYDYAEFSVLSNNGNEDYTCVYRVRVHGTFKN